MFALKLKVLVREKFVRNLDGNKKNIGKRTEQKRRLGGTGKGPAREKAEQGIVGQAEPGYGRAGENDGESGCEVRSEIKNGVKKIERMGNPRLTLIARGSMIYINIGSRANGLSPILL